MLSKKEIKDIQSLVHKKWRDEAGLFLAEGPKIVLELLQLIPAQLVNLYALKDWIEEHSNLLHGLPVTEITSVELQKISQLQTPNQVLCTIKQFDVDVPVLQDRFCIYLDTIQDPGNFGTIIRLADWFGVEVVVCTEGCADLYNPKVVQSSMASLARVQVYYEQDFQWIQQQTVPRFAAVLNGKSLYDFEKVTTGILMIGNESKGLDNWLQNFATERITIPKRGSAESLNAAVATGIILSHLL